MGRLGIMGLGEVDHRKVSFSSYRGRIYSQHDLSLLTLTWVAWLFVRFLHLSTVSSLEGSHHAQPTLKE